MLFLLASDHNATVTSSYDKINGFISPYVNPITTKLGRIVDQHTEVSANE